MSGARMRAEAAAVATVAGAELVRAVAQHHHARSAPVANLTGWSTAPDLALLTLAAPDLARLPLLPGAACPAAAGQLPAARLPATWQPSVQAALFGCLLLQWLRWLTVAEVCAGGRGWKKRGLAARFQARHAGPVDEDHALSLGCQPQRRSDVEVHYAGRWPQQVCTCSQQLSLHH